MLVPRLPMPWRILAVTAIGGWVGGAVLGIVLGSAHWPTLPFAVVEGAFLIGVPATVLGLLLTGLWSSGTLIRRRLAIVHRPH